MNRHVIALTIVTFLGAGLRLFNIDESLWLDELHSAWSVSGSLGEVASRAAQGNQPPLYYWVEWFVIQFLGQSEFALRILSLITGIAMIPVSWVIVRRFSGSEVGALLTAILVCINPTFIFFSIEFRGYIVVTFVGMLQITAFVQLLLGDFIYGKSTETPSEPKKQSGKSSKKKSQKAKPETGQQTASQFIVTHQSSKVTWKTRLVFCGLTVLLFNLHFTSILILLPEILVTLFAFCFQSFRQRYSFLQFVVDGVIIAAGCSPLAMTVLNIESKREDWAPIVKAVWPLRLDFTMIILGFLAPVLVLIIGYNILRYQSSIKQTRRKQGDVILTSRIMQVSYLFFAFAVCLIATVWLLTHFKIASLFLPRYIAVVLAAPMIAAGVAIGVFGRVFAAMRIQVEYLLAAILLCAAVASIYHYDLWVDRCLHQKTISLMRFEPWNDVVEVLNSIPADDEKVPVFLMSTLVEDFRLFKEFEPTDQFIEYCRFPVSGVYRLDRSKYRIIPIPSLIDIKRFKEQRVPDDVLERIASGKDAYVLARGQPVTFDLFNEIAFRLKTRNRELRVQPFASPDIYGEEKSQFDKLWLFRIGSAPLPK